MRTNLAGRVDDTLTIAINLVIIGLLWVIVYRYLNFTAALIAGLMYAFSPWAIWYSQPPLLLLYSLLLIPFAPSIYIFSETKGLARILCIPLFILLMYFYLVIILPSYSSGNTTSKANPFTYTIDFVTGLNVERAIEPAQAQVLLINVPRPESVWLLVLGSATLLGLPALWLKSRRIFLVVILWIGIPILLLALKISFNPEEILPVLPALCLLAGAGVAWLIKLMPGKPYSRMIILSAYGVVFLSQALWWRGVLRYLELTAR